jgi:hypothetical protein
VDDKRREKEIENAGWLPIAKALDAQHPNTWARGTWYPAKTSGGQDVEIRRTRGKGRVAGVPYLQVRRKARRIITYLDGTREDRGECYLYFRFNLRTGEMKEV